MTHNAIVLATDLSARCDRSLDRALMIAQEWRAQLVLLHVVAPDRARGSVAHIREIKERIAQQLPKTKVDIEILVGVGDIAETVIETARTKSCALIVTGVARYDSIGDIILGGPVDELIRKASAPVLVVKRRPKHAYKNILVATDFSDCSLQALNMAAEFFPDTRLHLVHAYHEPYLTWLYSEQVAQDAKSEKQRALTRFLAKREINEAIFGRMNGSIEKGDLDAVLARKIAATRSDLVVLGTHDRGPISRAALGSNADHVLEWTDEDVLIVPERQQA